MDASRVASPRHAPPAVAYRTARLWCVAVLALATVALAVRIWRLPEVAAPVLLAGWCTGLAAVSGGGSARVGPVAAGVLSGAAGAVAGGLVLVVSGAL